MFIYTFILYTRVWFNDSWFVIHDSSWSFNESYWTEHKITAMKPANKYQIPTIIHFFIKQKFCKYQFLQSRK